MSPNLGGVTAWGGMERPKASRLKLEGKGPPQKVVCSLRTPYPLSPVLFASYNVHRDGLIIQCPGGGLPEIVPAGKKKEEHVPSGEVPSRSGKQNVGQFADRPPRLVSGGEMRLVKLS